MRTFLLLLCIVAPAAACLNDREVARRDREFQSSYGDHPAAAEPAVPGPSVVVLAAGGIGLVLLGAAGAWLVLHRE